MHAFLCLVNYVLDILIGYVKVQPVANPDWQICGTASLVQGTRYIIETL